MDKQYNLKNIRALLNKGFSPEELRQLCFDEPDFRPVYDQLADGTGKSEIVQKLLDYAEQKELIETLLALAKKLNPKKYEKCGPYHHDQPEPQIADLTSPAPVKPVGQAKVSPQAAMPLMASPQKSKDPLIGQTFGQYRIVEKIGAGGMGTVYKAYQLGLDRNVALKILPAQLAMSPDFKERFLREARAVAQLSHPNILQVYGGDIKGDLSYFVMKYVSGHPLSQEIKSPLPLSKICHVIDQAAAALDHAHGRGILHRDIKPANMLLENEWLLLADFGLVKMSGDAALTATGAIMGTPAYISPEQAEGKPLDHHTDIYSLGVVLYEMLTGRTPYRGKDHAEVLLKHITEPPPRPSLFRPELSEAVEQVVLKALAKQPSERYHRAGDLAKSLRQAVTGENTEAVVSNHEPATVVSQSPPTPTPVTQTPQRLRLPQTWLLAGGGLAAVGLLFLVIGGIIFLWRGRTNSSQPTPGTITPDMAVVTPEAVAGTPITPPSTSANTPTALTSTPELTEQVLKGHTTQITDIAWSPDSARLASTSFDRTTRIWDATNGQMLQVLPLNEPGNLNQVTWSFEGSLLAVATSSEIQVWDAASGKKLHTLAGTNGAWSPHSSYLAVWDNNQIRIWEPTSGQELHNMKIDKGIIDVAWSPDKAYLASVGYGLIQIWDAANGQELHTIKIDLLSPARNLTWSPNGAYLTLLVNAFSIQVWDAANGQEMYTLGVNGSPLDIAWSPDSKRLAVLFDVPDEANKLQFWNTANWNEPYILEGRSFSGYSVAWSPNGAQLAVAGSDVIWLLDSSSGKPLGYVKGDKMKTEAWWSPDSTKLAAGQSNGEILVWSFADTHPEATPLPTPIPWPSDTPTPISTVVPAISGSGGRIVFVSERDGNSEIYVMNADGSEQTRLTNTPGDDAQPAWSPDGQRIAFSSMNEHNSDDVFVMNTNGSNLLQLTVNPAGDSSPTWSSNGQQIIFNSGRLNSGIYLMNSDGSDAKRISNSRVMVSDPAWSPDGQRIVFVAHLDDNREVFVMNTDGSNPTNLTNNPADDWDPAWSPDSQRLAFVSRRDGDRAIYVMNADGSSSPAKLIEGTNPAWSSDGQYLAFVQSVDDNSDIYIMNADGSNPIRLTDNPADDTEPAWAP